MEGCWILETRIRPMSLARSLSGLQLFSNVMLCHVEEKIRLCSADRKQQNEWYEELGEPLGTGKGSSTVAENNPSHSFVQQRDQPKLGGMSFRQ